MPLKIVECPYRDKSIFECLMEAIYDKSRERINGMVELILSNVDLQQEFLKGYNAADFLDKKRALENAASLFDG